MSRYLILVLLVVAVWWLLQGERRAAIRRRQKRATGTGAADAQAAGGGSPLIEREAMVACARCDLHLPISEALGGHERDEAGRPLQWFCGESHRVESEQKAARPLAAHENDVHR